MRKTWGIRTCFGCAKQSNPNAKGTAYFLIERPFARDKWVWDHLVRAIG